MDEKNIISVVLIPAIIVAYMMVAGKKLLREKEGGELVHSVSVLKVQKMTVIPRLLGYGEVQPAKSGKPWLR